jgi:hypothetical protein
VRTSLDPVDVDTSDRFLSFSSVYGGGTNGLVSEAFTLHLRSASE